MMTEEILTKYAAQAQKVLDSHHVRTGYDLAPTILTLVSEVRELQKALKGANESAEMYRDWWRARGANNANQEP